MEALLDIGRTKLTIDLSPIARDPRIEVVRGFCSLLNDNRAGRSHYSTLLYERIEAEAAPRSKPNESFTECQNFHSMPTAIRAYCQSLVRNVFGMPIAQPSLAASASFSSPAPSARGSPYRKVGESTAGSLQL